MAQLEVYSSRDVTITWGPHVFTGLAPDSFVTLTPNADITSEEVGADGQLQTSVLPDDTGTVTIQLQQNSLSNLALAGLLRDQKKGSRKFYRAPLIVYDPSGSVIAEAKNAYIKSRPELIRGSDAAGNVQAWMFFAEEMDYIPTPKGISDELRAQAEDLVNSLINAFTQGGF